MPAQPEDTAPAKAGGRPLGELEDATPVVLRVIKIETPEASVSGVFNFGGILEVDCRSASGEAVLCLGAGRLARARPRQAPGTLRHNKEGGAVVRDPFSPELRPLQSDL